jgi:hypothetical protein
MTAIKIKNSTIKTNPIKTKLMTLLKKERNLHERAKIFANIPCKIAALDVDRFTLIISFKFKRRTLSMKNFFLNWNFIFYILYR